MDWLNPYGLGIVVLMLIPNAIWARKFDAKENRCKNGMILGMEQIGRYGCMLMMCFHFGIAEEGFSSPDMLRLYLLVNGCLLLLYFLFWVLFFRQQKPLYAISLAVLPTCMFLLSGLLARNWLLAAIAVIFGIGHITMTAINSR